MAYIFMYVFFYAVHFFAIAAAAAAVCAKRKGELLEHAQTQDTRTTVEEI